LTDGTGPATHDNYITRHAGPQYFGYLGDNTQGLGSNLKGLGDFFTDIAGGRLPAQGGVFYICGGCGNNDGLVPVDPNATVQANFAGNDDHPGYSDAQISEALLADEVNAIAASPYWPTA
jgi:phospholipase C